MELNEIKTQTTWNDAAQSLNSNFNTISDQIMKIESGSQDSSYWATKKELEVVNNDVQSILDGELRAYSSSKTYSIEGTSGDTIEINDSDGVEPQHIGGIICITDNSTGVGDKAFQIATDDDVKGFIGTASESVDGLMTSSDKAKINNTNIAFGVCYNKSNIAAKTVTIYGNTNWVLEEGSIVMVYFGSTNTASNPTLNVNNTGAKSLVYAGETIAIDNLSFAGNQGCIATYVYHNGSYHVALIN